MTFLESCYYQGFVLTIALYLARWTCGQPVAIFDDEGDLRIKSNDYRSNK